MSRKLLGQMMAVTLRQLAQVLVNSIFLNISLKKRALQIGLPRDKNRN
jgi:hypothetical protein